MENIIGKDLGKYHIIEKLGEGGMANVYRAFDTHLERDVAVKVILPSREASGNFLERFEREARTLAKLLHPNIVQVIDYGHYENLPYLVMPFVPGGTLKKYLGEPLDFRQAARLLAPVARALHYAHQQGIIHRDVKPANILITTSGEPMLSDFGVAKMIESDTHLTGTGLGIGTPDYMPPEQWSGKALPQTDQYALGIILYELVTGRRPYVADTAPAVMFKHLQEPLPRPSEFAAVPEKVEKVLYKALAKDPNDRYADMDGFTRALENLISEDAHPTQLKPGKRRKPKFSPATSKQAEAETIDELDTRSVAGAALPSRKAKWIFIGIATLSLIGAGVYFGILRQNRLAATQAAPPVITQIVTPQTIVKVIEPTLTITPNKPNAAIPEEIVIEDIPLYDDFAGGLAGKYRITDWSSLENYTLEEENGSIHIHAQGEQGESYKAIQYNLNETKPVKAFFALIHINEISSNGLVILGFSDYNAWHNLGRNAEGYFINGENRNWSNVYVPSNGDAFWLGVVVLDEMANYYIDGQFVGKSQITGGIPGNEIGIEAGYSQDGGLDIEIEEVRILFDE